MLGMRLGLRVAGSGVVYKRKWVLNEDLTRQQAMRYVWQDSENWYDTNLWID